MSDIIEKFQLPSRYQEESNIWDDYTALTREYNPISLGQGFPDFLPLSSIANDLVETIQHGDASLHQYTRRSVKQISKGILEFMYFLQGHPRLVNALANLYSSLMKHRVDPYHEIVICSGGCATLHTVITGTVDEGDEVIVIEPSFDCYTTMVRGVGGSLKYIPLRLRETNNVITSADWVLDFQELQNAFSEKTKAIILNTPHNPFGKVFSLQELTVIANLCKKWNVLCISDEVYEWLVYEPREHIRIASLPGMWERCITIGSAGKTFCVTGWKVAWAIGPTHIIKNLQNQLIFNSNTIQQEAVGIFLEKELQNIGTNGSYFKNLQQILETKKSYMVKILREVGMKPIIPEGGIFVIADWSPLERKVNLSSEKDVYKDFRFTKWFAKNVRVLGIPVSIFYSKPSKHQGENFLRFCFIKVSIAKYLSTFQTAL
ncbi:hypothetical protein FQR65_LT10429 [Abscondita terminalis]|nr:hypothetical protein FQR65_LT10429 [Abscondita terminalis]